MNTKRKALITAVLSAGIISLAGCGSIESSEKEKGVLNFQQFASVEFDGVNGNGTIVITKNTDLYDDKDVLEKIYPGKSEKNAEKKLNDFMETVSFTASETSGLSNGDEVTVTVVYDEDALGNQIKIEEEEFVVTVEGLEESTMIDPFYGLSVEFSGNNGKGKVTIDKSNCNSFVKNYVTFAIDKKDDCSNGDSITIKAQCDESDLKKENVVLSKETTKYTVSGLETSAEIDPFEDLRLTYTGASPYITVSIDSTMCSDLVNNYIDFVVETDEEYLRNGESFKVAAKYNDYDAEREQFSIKKKEKEYTVENQPEMVTSLDGLELTKLHSELDDKLAAVTAASDGDGYFADVYIEYFKSIAEQKYQTAYLVSLKSQYEDKYDKQKYNYNRYIQIYEYTLNYIEHPHTMSAKDSVRKVYVAVYVNNICKNNDGTISWDLELGSKAYEDPDKLINEYITSEKEYYNVTEIKPQANEAE